MVTPASGIRATGETRPPPSTFGRAMRRERIDLTILRALGERRAYRTLRRHGSSSAWDRLEHLVALASTALWENGDGSDALSEDLGAFCAFLARELEINEQLDLPADKDRARLRELAPRALDALDAITGPLVVEESRPHLRALARVFGNLRAELLGACGAVVLKIAA